MMKIGFIGTGNMARAIIKGIIESKQLPNENIFVFNRDSDKTTSFAIETNTHPCTSSQKLAESVDVLVLAVKPGVIPTVLKELHTTLLKHQPLLVSIAAGTTIASLEDTLGSMQKHPIIRVMPNLNALIGKGMAAICSNQFASKQQISFVLDLFNSIGTAIELEEHHFSTFTAIAGSSPAYTFLFIDSLARGAVKNGMPKDLATKIATQAVLGSAEMLLASDKSPWDLIDQVSSPGGTTVAGLVALEDEAFISTVIKGVDATIKKDHELMND